MQGVQFLYITYAELESIMISKKEVIIRDTLLSKDILINPTNFDPFCKLNIIVRGILGTVDNYVILLKSMDELDKVILLGQKC